MFCKYCGKEIPDDSMFCKHCGKQLGMPEIEASQSQGWEYLTIVLHFRRGEAGWVTQEGHPAPVAQQWFWNDYAPLINEIEADMSDNEWQAFGEHGPSCVELDSYKSTEGKSALGMAIGAVASYGTSLLFARSWKFTMKSITLRWRRPTVEEGTSEEELHMWIDPQTGEWEPMKFDNTTKQWVPLEKAELEEDLEQQLGLEDKSTSETS
ncbi:MAG: zinc-ribbon domain-containing protein [Anaerolineales bacterium]|nr:zinc-ribbon domain-containing protein [Anaerolineales bacterium]